MKTRGCETDSTGSGNAESRRGNKPFLTEKERAILNFEREYFTRLLEKHRGNVSRAAREAGISRQNVFEKLKRLGIEPGRFR